MKKYVSKLLCVSVSLAMVASAAGCKKSESKKSTGAQKAAEDFLDAIIACDADDISEFYEMEDGEEEALEIIADNDFIAAVMDKATYEIDKKGVDEDDDEATVEAVIKLPDYEEAYEDADGDLDDFEDAIDDQKEKDYKEIEVTIEFDVDDDEYTCTNGDEVLDDIFTDMVETLMYGTSIDQPDPTTTNDDPDPIDPDPTTTKDDPADPTTTAPDLSDARSIGNVPKIDNLNYNAFCEALKAVGDGSIDNKYEYEPDEAAEIYDGCVAYVYHYGNSYNVSYSYLEFESVEDAKTFFDDNTYYLTYSTDIYEMNDDWGYCYFASSFYMMDYYWSGNVVYEVYTYVEADSDIDDCNAFWHAVGAY